MTRQKVVKYISPIFKDEGFSILARPSRDCYLRIARRLRAEREKERGEPVAWMWEHIFKCNGCVNNKGLSFNEVQPTDDAMLDGGSILTRVTPLYDAAHPGVSVPEEPTVEMRCAGDEAIVEAIQPRHFPLNLKGDGDSPAVRCYRAMLAARPSAAGQEVRLELKQGVQPTEADSTDQRPEVLPAPAAPNKEQSHDS